MVAIGAFRDYGKGRRKAALNIGDCFSYALAQATGYPLLFVRRGRGRGCSCRAPKGNDFVHTDIRMALP